MKQKQEKTPATYTNEKRKIIAGQIGSAKRGRKVELLRQGPAKNNTNL